MRYTFLLISSVHRYQHWFPDIPSSHDVLPMVVKDGIFIEEMTFEWK